MRTDFIEVKVNVVNGGDRPLNKMTFTMKKPEEKSSTTPTSVK
jgi:hypothetical protein